MHVGGGKQVSCVWPNCEIHGMIAQSGAGGTRPLTPSPAARQALGASCAAAACPIHVHGVPSTSIRHVQYLRRAYVVYATGASALLCLASTLYVVMPSTHGCLAGHAITSLGRL